jgi:hypothetical protein
VISGFLKVLVKFDALPKNPTRNAVSRNSWLFLRMPVLRGLESLEYFAAAGLVTSGEQIVSNPF